MTFKRYAPSAVLAVGVTIGITLGMADMIKAEFQPQEKAENMAFEINPQVEELPVVSRTERKTRLMTYKQRIAHSHSSSGRR